DVRALTLFDERDDAFISLVLDDQIERAEFFDLKVYENPKVLPRAYLVHRVIEAPDSEVPGLLARPEFQPAQLAVVEPGANLSLEPGSGDDLIDALDFRAEQMRLKVRTAARALLVLSDAYYPGWKVTVDGSEAALLRVNLGLRG